MTAILSDPKTQTAFEPEAIRVMSQAFDDMQRIAHLRRERTRTHGSHLRQRANEDL